jgi:hypothetical protein
MAQQGASYYDTQGISCYTVTTCPIVTLASDFVHNKYEKLQ